MKASDIRIGDWLNIYNFPNDNPKQDDLFPAKVSAVFVFDSIKEPDVADVELIFKNKEGGNAIASRPLDTCLLIELTEEILVKNGWFALDEYRYEGDVALAKESSGFRLKNTNICVNSVHQLQHLLRLCGIEKEIEV